MNLKPTKIKIIITLVILMISYYMMSNISASCIEYIIDNCRNYEYLNIMKNSSCGCVSFKTLIFQYVGLLLFPVLIYIYMSQERKQ